MRSSKYFVTRLLEEKGYIHMFPEKIKLKEIPIDNQISNSEQNYCMAPYICRRLLSVLNPNLYGNGIKKTTEETTNYMKSKFLETKICDPEEAYKRIISKPIEINLNEQNIKKIIDMATKMPLVLPYNVPFYYRKTRVISKDEYKEKFIDIFKNHKTDNKKSFHSICIAGIAIKDDKKYFVGVQSWEGYEILLFEPFTTEYIAKELCYDKELAKIIDMNVVYKHNNKEVIIDVPIPSENFRYDFPVSKSDFNFEGRKGAYPMFI